VLVMGRHERIVRPGDLLRRRTMLSMLHRHGTVAADSGVRTAVQLLLGIDGLKTMDKESGLVDGAYP